MVPQATRECAVHGITYSQSMNILLFTQVYPDEPGISTLRSSVVCHSWTKEWIKQGHRVVVAYCYPNYHHVFHWIAKLCPQFIAQFTNGTLTQRLKHNVEYRLDGVEVLKMPQYKIVPKVRYGSKTINGIIKEVKKYTDRNSFVPDLILSHFDNPILEIAGKYKKIAGVPCAFVLHGYAKDIKRLYPKDYRKLIDAIDVWGFRSPAIKKDFEDHFGVLKNSFLCYSGIPDSYLADSPSTIGKKKGKVVYVGALSRRKYPKEVLKALTDRLRAGIYSLTYIGEGALKNEISREAKRRGVEKQVTFTGHISRQEVQHHLSNADLFVMISRHETFGLVYLEAMAHGCLTIASKNEGFDGIIQDGVNGFLCEAGNVEELKSLINRIDSLPDSEKTSIRRNAIATASNMTEAAMARQYLENVTRLLGAAKRI